MEWMSTVDTSGPVSPTRGRWRQVDVGAVGRAGPRVNCVGTLSDGGRAVQLAVRQFQSEEERQQDVWYLP